MASQHTPRCVLVTGGLGFIGSYVVEAAHETYPEATIVVVDRCNYAASVRNIRAVASSPRLRVECFDLADDRAVEDCLETHRPQLILHLAAETHVDRSFANALDFTRGNVLGTHALLEAARRIWGLGEKGGGAQGCVFVHMSTDEVYGSGAEAGRDGHSPQTSILAPTNPYAASKAAAEMQCIAYHRSFGMDVRIIRCNNVYGPRQFCEKVVPRFALQSLAGKPLTIHGDGTQQRSFLFATDAAAAVLAVARAARAGEIVNVGSEEEISILELARRLTRVAGEAVGAAEDGRSSAGSGEEEEEAVADAVPLETSFARDRLFNDYRYPVNIARIRDLGWNPTVLLREGLRRTVRWYREHAHEWFAPDDLAAATDTDGHFGGAAPQSGRDDGLRDTSEARPEGGEAGKAAPRVLLYGATGWIGTKIAALLRSQGVAVAAARARLEDTGELWRELEREAPTHVICAAGITGRPNIDWCEAHPEETVAANLEGTVTLALFCARRGVHLTNFATGCIYVGGEDTHFGEDDEPNFLGSLYSRTKVHAEKLQRGAAGDNTLILRLRMPIDADLDHTRNLVNKLARYGRLVDVPNSVSVLPELLPVALHLALAHSTGVYNLTNPGWTTPADIRALFDARREEYPAAFRDVLPPRIPFQRESAPQKLVEAGNIVAQRSNCVLAAAKIDSYARAHGFYLRTAELAVRAVLDQAGRK